MEKHTTPFRDPLPGALARRRELLSSRRDDFVEMPDAIRRTYVARWGRIGGGMAAALVGSGLLALVVLQSWIPALGEALYSLAEELLPGKRPAVLATLAMGAWIAGGFGWLLARACAERAFARRTAEAALPSGDVNHDIERLAHVTPAHIGQSDALRIEGASVGLPLFALALLLPTAAVYLVLAAAVGGYPKEAVFETGLVDGTSGLAALAAGGLALAMTLRLGLRWWTTSRLKGVAGAVGVLGAAGAVAIAIIGWGAIAAGLAALTFAGARALLVVRRERIALGLGDSSAAALDESIGRSLSKVTAFVRLHADRFARAVAVSWPARTLRRLAANPRSMLRRRALLLAVAAGFAAGAVAFSLRSPEPEKVAWPAEAAAVASLDPAADPLPELASTTASSGASLAPESTQSSGLAMVFTFGDSRPAEARWRALVIPPPSDPMAGWRVTVNAQILDQGNRYHGVPEIGLSPFRDTELQFGRTWQFASPCTRSPVVEWRAVADTGRNAVRIGWSAQLESCSPGM